MVEAKSKQNNSSTKEPSSSFRWFLGLLIASVFSSSYFLVPFYFLTALVAVLVKAPYAWYYAAPILLSAVIPPIPCPWLVKLMTPLLNYFDYEEIHERHPIDVQTEMIQHNKNYLCVCQPHGALTYVGIVSGVTCQDALRGPGKLPTAVADALLITPILKHVLGIFGLISASKPSMMRTMKKKGAEGTIVLYVGGVAELFLSDETKERLYLNKRKGFVKLALQEGVDVVPIYMFGNTTVLSVLKNGPLAELSRKIKTSITYIWGKWYL
jgi:hypothetical protein